MFQDEESARRELERLRWPNGPRCPHPKCRSDKVALIGGGVQRPGLYGCKVCRRQFSVTVRTALQGSRVPLTGWWRAASLLSANERDTYVSASDIQRALGVHYRTAHGVLWTILDAGAAFRGHVTGFGKPIQDHVRKRTKRENKKRGLAWSKVKEARDAADQVLGFVSSPSSSPLRERTERLLSLLLHTDSKSRTLKYEAEKSAEQRSIGRRRTKHSSAPRPTYLGW
ncbi:transposase [Bradyrhizobium jicamae]|nr:transposase [Bradyrhizobium jicamae]